MADPTEGSKEVERRTLLPPSRDGAPLAADRPPELQRPSQKPPRVAVRHRVKAWAMDADPRSIKGPKTPLLVIGLLTVLGTWDDLALALLLPEIRAEFGLTLTFLAALNTVFGFIAIAAALPMGWVVDRVKRVWLVRFGAIASNVGSLAFAAARTVPQMVGARVIGGVSGIVSGPAGLPLFTDYYASSARARVVSFLGICRSLGGLVGPVVAGVLAVSFGWRAAVISLAVLALVVSLSSFLLKEPPRGYVDRLEMGASEEVARREQRPVSLLEGWRAAMSVATLRRLNYATPFLHIGGVGAGLFMALYWAEVWGLDPRARGFLIAGAQILGILGLVFAGPVADGILRFRPGRVMTLTGLLGAGSALAYLGLAFSPWLWLAIIISLPGAFAAALLDPAADTVLSMVVPARIRGLGLQTRVLFRIPGLFVTPLVVALAEQMSLRMGMLLFVPLLIVGSMIVASASIGVERDIRAARAASLAQEEVEQARRRGRSKMLVCRDLDVAYDGVQVLFNVDFDVNEGEVVALLGTNGAGKSTLLRAISGLQEASNGAIFFDGHDITHAPPHENAASGIVMVPGGQATFPTLTIEENLRTAAWMYRADQDLNERMRKALDLFPVLRDRRHQAAGNLSGGEQQMLALAQAFIMRPRLLVIDELSLGLAPKIVEQLLLTLRQINAEGTTIILVEQSLNVAARAAARAVFMEKGEIRFNGSMAELLRSPELVRAVFMGGAARGRSLAPTSTRPTRAAGNRILEVKEVEVSFGGVRALAGVSVELGAGEIVGIIGPNGAGKTTLFDVIAGFIHPYAGQVKLDGIDVSHLGPDARARLGLNRSFQLPRLFPSMTVRENLAVACQCRIGPLSPLRSAVWSPRARKAERRTHRRVATVIGQLALQPYADKFVNELSTGTRRVVELGCLMAAQPRVLLLDEPSSGLAQSEAEELGPALGRIVRESGCGLLVIEHDIPLISSIADRLVAMDLGRVVVSGPPGLVQDHPGVVASYLAASGDVIASSESVDPGA